LLSFCKVTRKSTWKAINKYDALNKLVAFVKISIPKNSADERLSASPFAKSSNRLELELIVALRFS
jgi:hypothetical protein